MLGMWFVMWFSGFILLWKCLGVWVLIMWILLSCGCSLFVLRLFVSGVFVWKLLGVGFVVGLFVSVFG